MATEDSACRQSRRVFCVIPASRLRPEAAPFEGCSAQDPAMNFLLDTNAVSEWTKPRPNSGLIRWMESVDEDRTFISVISLAEIRYGIERLPAGHRRRRLDEWLHRELPLRFESRTLPIDDVVADAWGKTVSRSEA